MRGSQNYNAKRAFVVFTLLTALIISNLLFTTVYAIGAGYPQLIKEYNDFFQKRREWEMTMNDFNRRKAMENELERKAKAQEAAEQLKKEAAEERAKEVRNQNTTPKTYTQPKTTPSVQNEVEVKSVPSESNFNDDWLEEVKKKQDEQREEFDDYVKESQEAYDKRVEEMNAEYEQKVEDMNKDHEERLKENQEKFDSFREEWGLD